jgi:hypothetical protein
VFIAHGNVLQPDFSLLSQNIADNSKISVIFKRKHRCPAAKVSRHGSTIVHEQLRLADLSFLPFETCRARRRRRRHGPVLTRGRPELSNIPKPIETIVEKALAISEDPLPELLCQIPPSSKKNPDHLLDAS